MGLTYFFHFVKNHFVKNHEDDSHNLFEEVILVSLGVSICLDMVSIETLDLDTGKE